MTKAERQEEWEARIAEYQSSGQGAKTWCATHNVTPSQLWYWLKKLKTIHALPSANSANSAVKWLPLEVSDQSSVDRDNTLLVRVGPASIEVKPGFDPALLSEIVRVLMALC